MGSVLSYLPMLTVNSLAGAAVHWRDLDRTPQMLWFTADWHLEHKNIIKYCNRPFSNIGEMNWTIIDNCNSLVRPEDSLYFLGDFCLSYNESVVESWLMQIKCRNLYLVYGNHDQTLLKNKGLVNKYFRAAGDMLVVKEIQPNIILNHYKMCIWDRQHYGTYHLYGHSHGTANDNVDRLSFDVGVDCHNFFPLSFNQVKERMATKTWRQNDHHRSATT